MGTCACVRACLYLYGSYWRLFTVQKQIFSGLAIANREQMLFVRSSLRENKLEIAGQHWWFCGFIHCLINDLCDLSTFNITNRGRLKLVSWLMWMWGCPLPPLQSVWQPCTQHAVGQRSRTVTIYSAASAKGLTADGWTLQNKKKFLWTS